jgi:hypothetical protein
MSHAKKSIIQWITCLTLIALASPPVPVHGSLDKKSYHRYRKTGRHPASQQGIGKGYRAKAPSLALKSPVLRHLKVAYERSVRAEIARMNYSELWMGSFAEYLGDIPSERVLMKRLTKRTARDYLANDVMGQDVVIEPLTVSKEKLLQASKLALPYEPGEEEEETKREAVEKARALFAGELGSAIDRRAGLQLFSATATDAMGNVQDLIVYDPATREAVWLGQSYM